MTWNQELILVDVDETCARTIEDWVYPIVNKLYWINLAHHTTYEYRDVFWKLIVENGEHITLQRKIEIFNWAVLQDRWINWIQPIVGSVEKILELSDQFKIWMLTARHSMLTEYTTEWTNHHYNWLIGKILFSNCYYGSKRTKPTVCKEEWARIMIEDDMDYALELAQAWILVFLLRKPWNIHRKENHRNIKKIDTWDDIKM